MVIIWELIIYLKLINILLFVIKNGHIDYIRFWKKYNNYDNKLSYKYYKQVAINFNKFSLNEYIYTRNVNKDGYHRDNNLHIYKTNSFSKLSIYGTCLILKTNDMNSIFLNDIYYSEDNIFICDFINNDYFWLDSLIIDRQKEELLV